MVLVQAKVVFLAVAWEPDQMDKTAVDLFRSVRVEQFPSGTLAPDNQPAPEVLYPDFEDRKLPNGKIQDQKAGHSNLYRELVRKVRSI
jgi:hypothetical protein